MKAIGIAIAALCASVVSVAAHAVDCTGLPEWNSTVAYVGSTKVQEAGKAYTAAWWSQGHSPASYSGQWQEWKFDGNCEVANRPPVAVISVQSSNLPYGQAGTVIVTAAQSSDPDGNIITYSWDGGAFTSVPTYTITTSGYFDNCEAMYRLVTLTVKDPSGATGTVQQLVKVADPAPGNPRCVSSSSVTPSSKSVSSSSTRTTSSSSSFTWVESSSSGGNNCTSPQYVAGTAYAAGQLVQNAGNEYVCNIAGWCSSSGAWAYAPGTGTYWDQAWSLVRSCGVTKSSSSYSSVSSISSQSSTSASSVPNTGLPKHAMVGYWHNFNNGSGLIRLADVDNTWDVIVIAFADDSGNGNVAFNLDSGLNKAQFIADVAAKRAAGKKVVLSFGGQNGTVTLNNSTNVTNFVASTTAILNEYGFDGIDIDLESGAGVAWGAGVVTNLPIAVKQLKAKFPNLYLSMAPEHPYVQGGFIAASGIWGAYLPMIDSLRNELTILHVQLYNNGGLSTPYSNQPLQAGTVDFMVGSIKMLIEGFPMANNTTFQGLRPDQVAIGVPSGSRAAGSGFVTINDLNNAVNCVAKLVGCGAVKPNQAYPAFRGVMTWSINWDVADGRPFSVPVKANLNALP